MNGKTTEPIMPKNERPDYTGRENNDYTEIWTDENGSGVVVTISRANTETKDRSVLAIELTVPAAREIAKRLNLIAAEIDRKERSRALAGQLSLLTYEEKSE